MTSEKPGEEYVQLAALGWVQVGEQLVLGDIGVPLDLLEIPAP